MEARSRSDCGSRDGTPSITPHEAKIASLDHTATRRTIPEGTSTTTMKHRTLRVAAACNIPVTFADDPWSRLHQESFP